MAMETNLSTETFLVVAWSFHSRSVVALQVPRTEPGHPGEHAQLWQSKMDGKMAWKRIEHIGTYRKPCGKRWQNTRNYVGN